MEYKIKTRHLKRIVQAAEENGIKSIRIDTRKHTIMYPDQKDTVEFILEDKDDFFDFVEFQRRGKKMTTKLSSK